MLAGIVWLIGLVGWWYRVSSPRLAAPQQVGDGAQLATSLIINLNASVSASPILVFLPQQFPPLSAPPPSPLPKSFFSLPRPDKIGVAYVQGELVILLLFHVGSYRCSFLVEVVGLKTKSGISKQIVNEKIFS